MSVLQLMATRGAGGASLPTPTIWYDASDTSTITNVSGKASAIADKGSSGDDLIQSTDANRPLTGSTTQNGLNTLDYSADSKTLAKAGTTTSNISVTFFVGYVPSAVNYLSAARYLLTLDNSVWYAGFTALGSAVGSFTNEFLTVTYGGTSSRSAATGTSQTIGPGVAQVTVRWTGTIYEMYINGGSNLKNASAAPETQQSVNYIGLNSGGFSLLTKGWDQFCEMRGFSSTLTTDEVNAVGSALATKWGITWTNIS